MFETTDELLKQIRLGEDSSLELKDLRYKGNQVNDPHRNSMADELAAMANTANGVFVLGVDDKSRTVVGIPEDKLDVVETWVCGICNDLITPQLFPDSKDSSRYRRRCGTGYCQSRRPQESLCPSKPRRLLP